MHISFKLVFSYLVVAVVGSMVTYLSLQYTKEPFTYNEVALQQPPSDSPVPATNEMDIDQQLKDLRTKFIGDERSIAEKLGDFLAQNPGQQNIAIASKVVVDLAANHDLLTDKDLIYLYQHQLDLTLKRVLAQVLSLRGDNHLLDTHIAHLKNLHIEAPEAQQNLLVELAKTHYIGAVSIIEPLLQSDNVGVILNALLALRATGNESHLHYAEALVNHPDQSVNWLASDVINQLQYLSKKARTRLILADIIIELPPI